MSGPAASICFTRRRFTDFVFKIVFNFKYGLHADSKFGSASNLASCRNLVTRRGLVLCVRFARQKDDDLGLWHEERCSAETDGELGFNFGYFGTGEAPRT